MEKGPLDLARLQTVSVWSSLVLLLQAAIGTLYSGVPPYLPLVTAAWIGLAVHAPVFLSCWIWKKVHLVLIPGMLVVAIVLFVFVKIPVLGVCILTIGFFFFVFGFFQGKLTLRSLAAIMLLVLVVVGLAWGTNYLFFFPLEAGFQHVLHRDTMLHSAVASFIGNNLYPSVGIAGSEYFPYNWLADYVIAALAQSCGQPAYVVICLVYPVVVFSLVLYTVLNFLDLKNVHQERFVMIALSFILLGLFPLPLLSSAGIWPESFMQESFLLSVGLYLITIKELLSTRRSPWQLPLIFLLTFLTGMAKVSAAFVLVFFVLGLVIQRRDWRTSISTLLVVGLGALFCYQMTKGRTTELVFGPLQNLRSPLWFAPLELALNITPGVILWFLWWRSKILKVSFSVGTQALHIGVLVSGIAVFLLYCLFSIRGGAGYYFLETWRLSCWITIAITLSETWALGIRPVTILIPNFVRWRALSPKALLAAPLVLLLAGGGLNLFDLWGALAGKHLNVMGSEPSFNRVVESAKNILRGRDFETVSDLGVKLQSLFSSVHRLELPIVPATTRGRVVIVESPEQWETLLGSSPVEPLYLAGLTGLPVAGLIQEQYLSQTMYGYGEMTPLLARTASLDQLKHELYALGYQSIYRAERVDDRFRLRPISD